MIKGQRGAKFIARQQGKIGADSDLFSGSEERLAFLARMCRGINPADVVSIRPAGAGVVAVLTNGTTAKFGCW